MVLKNLPSITTDFQFRASSQGSSGFFGLQNTLADSCKISLPVQRPLVEGARGQSDEVSHCEPSIGDAGAQMLKISKVTMYPR